jgi:hypothetical protein
MKNNDIQAAWKYHDGTKHSYWGIRNNPHFLDGANPSPSTVTTRFGRHSTTSIGRRTTSSMAKAGFDITISAKENTLSLSE